MRWKLEKNIYRKFGAFGAVHFFDGLISIVSAQQTNEVKWINHALECVKKTKASTYTNPQRVLLLETEIDVLMGKTKDAIEGYNKAINTASENKYINEQAIANERA
eukprot:6595989-Ditylum_brightwellii.AAC.1